MIETFFVNAVHSWIDRTLRAIERTTKRQKVIYESAQLLAVFVCGKGPSSSDKVICLEKFFGPIKKWFKQSAARELINTLMNCVGGKIFVLIKLVVPRNRSLSQPRETLIPVARETFELCWSTAVVNRP